MNDAPHNPASSPSAPPAASPHLTRFFDWVRSTGIDRGHDRWFAGVCGGIAYRTGLDPLIVRGIAIVLAILGAPVLFAYAIGWALLPNQSGRIHAEQAFRGVFEPAMIAIGALILFTIVPFSRGLWWEGPPLAWGMPDWLATTFTVGWTIAVIVGIVWLVIYLLRRVPAPNSAFRSPPPPAPSGPPAPPYSPPAPAAPPAPSGSTAFVTNQSGTTDAPAEPAAASGSGFAAFVGAGAPTAAGAPAGASVGAPVGAPAATPAAPAAGFATDSAAGPAAFGATAAGAAGAGSTFPSTAQPRSAWDALVEQTTGATGSKADWSSHTAHTNRYAAARENRHPGAGFTAIMLGIGLTAGAAASAVYSGVFGGGTWSNSALLIGLAFTLGVLALGIIIAGIRGRTSGAMGGFAFLAAAALLVLSSLGVLPQGTQFVLVGAPTWSVSASSVDAVPGYAVVVGAPTINLTALDNARATDRTIDVWLGIGQTELVLPDNRPVTVEVNTLIGGLDYEATSSSNSGSDQSSTERGGVFLHDSRTFNGAETRAVAHIRVWTFIGQVNVVDAH